MTPTTITPNWRRFAARPWTVEHAKTVNALGLQIPPEGRTYYFVAGYCRATRYHEQKWQVSNGVISKYLIDPDSVLRQLTSWGLSTGTPSGDALRQWLRMWGWLPVSERQEQAEPQAETRTIT